MICAPFVNFASMKAAKYAFCLLGICLMSQVSGQTGLDTYNAFWQKTDSAFNDPTRSPLPQELVAKFDSVPRYGYNPDFRLSAKWVESPKEKPFEIETTTDRKARYQKLGELHFHLFDTDVRLPVYKNVELSKKVGFDDYIFVPFTDLSNGHTTYMGGRYLDMRTFESDSVVIDFNLAYNPYCVYSEKYSCPIPPQENYIPVFIAAGAKVDQK